jgi:hypothetical protein
MECYHFFPRPLIYFSSKSIHSTAHVGKASIAKPVPVPRPTCLAETVGCAVGVAAIGLGHVVMSPVYLAYWMFS